MEVIPIRTMLFLAAALLALCLPFAASAETRVMVVSDLHYLAPELYEGSELFLQALMRGDGKYAQHGEELMEALVEEVKHQQPDALLVTGDLAYNGEKASHERLAAFFARIEADGTPVWVITGNHDINVTRAIGFQGNGWYTTDSVTEEEFASIYAPFLMRDENAASAGFSYCVPVSDRLRVAMTDVANYEGEAQVFGLFTTAHQTWLEGVLAGAERDGAEVITASHHSLIPHSSYSKESYVMFGNQAMEQQLARHGVRLHLSGHLHIQHIAEKIGVTDAATGAFCNTPHRYAMITLADDGTLTYEACALCGEHLPEGFQAESRGWFAAITREKSRASLAELNLPEEDMLKMLSFSTRFNLAYFDGTFDPADPSWLEDEAYALWESCEGSGFGAYLLQVIAEGGGNNLLRALPPR